MITCSPRHSPSSGFSSSTAHFTSWISTRSRAGSIRPRRSCGVSPNVAGIHVDAAGDEDAVHPLVDRPQRLEVVEQRDEHRRRTSRSDGVVVALVHDHRVRQPLRDAINGLKGLRRDTDQRTRHG